MNISALFSKILVGTLVLMLVLSFALWGIGDLFRSGNESLIATIGDREITEREFNDEVNRYLQLVRELSGGAVNAQQTDRARARVLATLINQSLLSEKANDMKLYVHTAAVARNLQAKYPELFEGGQLNEAMLSNWLRNQGLNETLFIAEQKAELKRTAIASTMAKRSPVITTQLQKLAAYDHEKRTIELITYPKRLFDSKPKPTDIELITYFEEHTEEFNAPEYRMANYVMLSAEALEDSVAVGEDELAARYEQEIDRFITPASREIAQLLFDDEVSAKEAYDALIAGKDADDFDEVTWHEEATKAGLAASGLIPQAALDALFTGKAGLITEPQAGELGWYVFVLEDTSPQITKPLEDVRDTLEDELRAERVDQLLYESSMDIEDSLAGGATLAEIASDYGVTLERAGPMDKSGNNQGGTSSGDDYPGGKEFVDTLFGLPEGVTSSVTPLPGEAAYYVLEVAAVAAPRPRALDEVRPRVVDAWQQQRVKELEHTMAEQILSDLQAKLEASEDGVLKSAWLREHDLDSDTIEGMTRKSENDDVPVSLHMAAFEADKGGLTPLFMNEDGRYVIAYVSGVSAADVTDEAVLDAVRADIQTQIQDDLLAQYLLHLQAEYPVKVGKAASE